MAFHLSSRQEENNFVVVLCCCTSALEAHKLLSWPTLNLKGLISIEGYCFPRCVSSYRMDNRGFMNQGWHRISRHSGRRASLHTSRVPTMQCCAVVSTSVVNGRIEGLFSQTFAFFLYVIDVINGESVTRSICLVSNEKPLFKPWFVREFRSTFRSLDPQTKINNSKIHFHILTTTTTTENIIVSSWALYKVVLVFLYPHH